MKKLIIASAITLLATVVNAAAMNWSSSDEVVLPSGSIAEENGVTMYLFAIDATTYGTLTAGGDSSVSSAVWGTYGGQLASAVATGAYDGMGAITLTDGVDYGNGQTAYCAVIFTTTESATDYYKGNVGSYTFDASTDITIVMDSMVRGHMAGSTALTWTATPEPTSGLLLLLGLAGLALRRRRV